MPKSLAASLNIGSRGAVREPKPETGPTNYSERLLQKLIDCNHFWGDSWYYESGLICMTCSVSKDMYDSFINS